MKNAVSKRLFMVAVSAGLLGGVAWLQAEDHGHGHGHNHAHAELGKAAPAFELKGIDGKECKLSDFKGKVVVLEWMNHECPFVKKAHEAKLMTGTFAKFKDEPVVWMGIDSSWFCEDKSDSIRDWAKKMKIGYPILLDAKGMTGHQYGARSTPHMFVIDKEGNLAYMGAPDSEGNDGEKRNHIEETVTALLKGSAVPVARTKAYGCSVKYRK